jgi:hypothetical protein
MDILISIHGSRHSVLQAPTNPVGTVVRWYGDPQRQSLVEVIALLVINLTHRTEAHRGVKIRWYENNSGRCDRDWA